MNKQMHLKSRYSMPTYPDTVPLYICIHTYKHYTRTTCVPTLTIPARTMPAPWVTVTTLRSFICVIDVEYVFIHDRYLGTSFYTNLHIL